MTESVRPFLMFQGGVASAALDFYLSLFPDARVDAIERYGAGDSADRFGVSWQINLPDQTPR